MTQLSPVSDEFETRLRAVLPEACFRPVTGHYTEEPRGRYHGAAGLVLAPETTQQVAEIVRLASAAHVPIVPFGGGTGLVGGQVVEAGPAPVILSMERMAGIRAVYPSENVMVVDAGAILADVQAAAADVDRLFPLSLASEGSARIGGLLATNAGGVNVLRYGNARDLCLGLEVVLPSGEIWNGLTRLRKDNLGYDLRNLMIGSEGSLGIITGATLKLLHIPAVRGTGLFVVPSPEAALALLALARSRVGECVSAFELISGQGFAFLEETLPDIRRPLDPAPEWCVLIELGLPAGLEPDAALAAMFEDALAQGVVSDGLIAQSDSQRGEFWAVREHIPEANRRIGSVSSHDISLPLSSVPLFITQANAAMGGLGPFRVNCFGHLGDGNLHYNVFPNPGKTRADYDHLRQTIKTTLHDLVHQFDGSVAAEHGVGRLKVADVERYADPAHLMMMRSVKAALDPDGIMNPGVILRG